jgi:AraC family transcriptional regulator, transcriptional activator FtrA
MRAAQCARRERWIGVELNFVGSHCKNESQCHVAHTEIPWSNDQLTNKPMSGEYPPMSKPPLVVTIAYDRMGLFEAGIAAEVFALKRPEFPNPLYRMRVAQAEPGELKSLAGLSFRADASLRLLRNAKLVIVPGWRDHREVPPQSLVRALQRAHALGIRIMSICTGAFVLAAAGLLDGRRATTHWRYGAVFREMYPQVNLDPDALYVDEGDVLTSAGSAAGIDACLHIVRKDYGAAVANTIARTMVSVPHRCGGQAQYISRPMPRHENRGLAPIMAWARENLQRSLHVPQLAARAAMSERTFLRRFLSEAGTTPKIWLQQEKVRLAQRMLETAELSLVQVAEKSGFASIETFRAAFRKIAGVAPSEYRRNFLQP